MPWDKPVKRDVSVSEFMKKYKQLAEEVKALEHDCNRLVCEGYSSYTVSALEMRLNDKRQILAKVDKVEITGEVMDFL